MVILGRIIMSLESLILVMKLVGLNSCLPTSIILVPLDGGYDGRGFWRMLELGGLLDGDQNILSPP